MPFIEHIPPKKVCLSAEHKPPTHIVLEPGIHIWQCPACGEQTPIEIHQITIISNNVIFKNAATHDSNRKN